MKPKLRRYPVTDGGTKKDEGKLRVDLIPVTPLLDWAHVLTLGAEKYGDRNWEEGIQWSRVYAAAMRHLLAWWKGEDLDPEMGTNHLANAICNIGFLLEYAETHPELDDRKLPQQREREQ